MGTTAKQSQVVVCLIVILAMTGCCESKQKIVNSPAKNTIYRLNKIGVVRKDDQPFGGTPIYIVNIEGVRFYCTDSHGGWIQIGPPVPDKSERSAESPPPSLNMGLHHVHPFTGEIIENTDSTEAVVAKYLFGVSMVVVGLVGLVGKLIIASSRLMLNDLHTW